MDESVRQRMTRSTVLLLSREGYAGTSLQEILALADAPRGSIYHHFPGGKDELIDAAVAATLQVALDALEPLRGLELDVVLERFSRHWRGILERTDGEGACAIMAVATGADKQSLRDVAAAAFSRWEDALASVLEASGVDALQSRETARYLLAAYEGAVMLARARGDLSHFDDADRVIRRSALDRPSLTTP